MMCGPFARAEFVVKASDIKDLMATRNITTVLACHVETDYQRNSTLFLLCISRHE